FSRETHAMWNVLRMPSCLAPVASEDPVHLIRLPFADHRSPELVVQSFQFRDAGLRLLGAGLLHVRPHELSVEFGTDGFKVVDIEVSVTRHAIDFRFELAP